MRSKTTGRGTVRGREMAAGAAGSHLFDLSVDRDPAMALLDELEVARALANQ
jgi:hypothetical protein